MPAHSLVNPADSLERQNAKLGQIVDVLMRRVEHMTDKDGAAYDLFQRAVTLEDQVGERTRDLGRALDLLNDSNARLEAANREAERARADLASAIEAIREGFAIFDAEDRLVLCNSRFGMHIPDVVAHLKPGLAFAAYIAMVSESRFLHLDPGETPATWASQRIARHGDDHVMFNVRMAGDRWVQVSEHRMGGGRTVVTQTDISDIIRKQRMEHGRIIDDQARRIRATLEHLNQGICTFDDQGRLVGFNQRLAALLPLPLTHLRAGLDFDVILRWVEGWMTFPPGISTQAMLDWASRTDSRPPMRFEVRRGEAVTLDVMARELPDRGFVISFTDVSAERNAARALHDTNERLEQRVAERTLELEDALAATERAMAARNRFIAAASHDLLQPLSAAKLFLSSVGDDPSSATTRPHEAIGKAQNALASMQDIIEALLDISKLESGRAGVSVTSIDLGRLLSQLRDEFTPLAAQKGLKLVIRPSALRVESDPRYLRRILQNLIANAVRYTETGGVVVGVRRGRRRARIEVWDSGPGIPESEFDRIFQEFHRLNARGSTSEGLGLGLAIVERACALLNHPVEVASRLDRGSRFRITVPLSGGRSEPARHPALASGPERSFPGLVVLLVENDRDVRSALCHLLEKWEVEVLDVGSGAEAMALIEDTGLRPDALLVDFLLDEGELGSDVITRLRSMCGPVPARIITANRGLRPAQLPAEILFKPIEPARLAEFLAEAEEFHLHGRQA